MASQGNEHELNELIRSLYEDLHRIAARHVRDERPDHTLQATALLHEVYLRLSGDRQRQFTDKSHFLAVASRVMRQVLVDYARARSTKKRAGRRVNDTDGDFAVGSLQLEAGGAADAVEIIELNRAIEALSLEDESLAQLIEMRYFGGMTAQETAAALGLSVHVVRHDLRLAQAWLRRQLNR